MTRTYVDKPRHSAVLGTATRTDDPFERQAQRRAVDVTGMARPPAWAPRRWLPGGGHGGAPLSKAARAYFEPRFGHDFSKVRVHADEAAANAARREHSVAFTQGQDIVFGAEAYAPGTPDGDRVLAHELAHVVQQRGHVQ